MFKWPELDRWLYIKNHHSSIVDINMWIIKDHGGETFLKHYDGLINATYKFTVQINKRWC